MIIEGANPYFVVCNIGVLPKVGVAILGGAFISTIFFSKGMPFSGIDGACYGSDEGDQKAWSIVEGHRDRAVFLDVISRVCCVAAIAIFLIGTIFHNIVFMPAMGAVSSVGILALFVGAQQGQQALLEHRLYLQNVMRKGL